MPTVPDDPAANRREAPSSLCPDRGMELVILLARTAVEELCAPGAHCHFGMAPKPNQLVLVEVATTTPASRDGHCLGFLRGDHALIIPLGTRSPTGLRGDLTP